MVCEKPNGLHSPAPAGAASEMSQVLYYEYHHDHPKNFETPSYAASDSDICRCALWNKSSSEVPHLQAREERLVVLSTPHLLAHFVLTLEWDQSSEYVLSLLV